MSANNGRFDVGKLEAQGTILVHVITDKKTEVQYLLAISPNMGSGMTAILDADGKPFTQKGI